MAIKGNTTLGLLSRVIGGLIFFASIFTLFDFKPPSSTDAAYSSGYVVGNLLGKLAVLGIGIGCWIYGSKQLKVAKRNRLAAKRASAQETNVLDLNTVAERSDIQRVLSTLDVSTIFVLESPGEFPPGV